MPAVHHTIGRRIVGALALVACTAAAAPAQTALKPVRAAVAPVIDGRLDDAVWQSAPSVTGFKTWTPDFGVEMKDQTIAYFAYDADNVYFAFRVFDSEPNRIKASVAARDTIGSDDWICINLDSFGDQQSLYGLYINPLGIQADSRFAANREDFGFDAVWYSAGRIDETGYTLEVRIPFKSLRYGRGSLVTMRLIFERRVSRRSEQGTYPPLDPKIGPNFLTQNIPIEFADIKHYTLLELLPDAVYSRQLIRTGPGLERVGGGPDFGLTAKYGLGSQLVIDGALNPDFSQVEADAGQIDINRRYALYFPEKRPFFLEGRDTFNLAGGDYSPLQSVVHTRTIENPIGGVKVAGKLSRADTVSTIYAVDEVADSAASGGGVHYEQAFIGRYKRALSQDSYVGGFYTDRERPDEFNRVFGADGSIRVTPAAALGFHLLGSTTREAGVASTADGTAALVNYLHDSRNLSYYAGALNVSPAFQTWTGYLVRTGLFEGTALITPRVYPHSDVLRRVDFQILTDHIRDRDSAIWEGLTSGTVSLQFPKATRLSVGYHHSSEVYEGELFDTSGAKFSLNTQPTKRLTVGASASYGHAIYYTADPLGGTSPAVQVVVRYQASDRWEAEVRATYSGFTRASDGQRLYDYTILRGKLSYQVNRYLFFRGIGEYNAYRRQLVTDLLASFTYIPGTVLHVGYGSLYDKTRWTGDGFAPSPSLLETRRGFFFKASYLWRR